MNNLTFSDGMTFDTDGDYRIEERHDGLYVVGRGLLCYVDTREEGRRMIADCRQLDKPQGMDKCSECDNRTTREWYERPMCEEHYRLHAEAEIRKDAEYRRPKDDEEA